MSTFTDIATESPLEAYLRLRGDGGSFLLESVEHGRLGRHSFVGRGSRIVSFEDAETCGEPVVGYLAYDHVARLEPTVPLPADGPPFPESRFLVADELIRFDHGDDTPPLHRLPRRPCTARSRRPPEYEELVRRAQGAHRGRRRLPGRPLAAGRAADERLAGRALPRAPPRQSRRPTSSCSSSMAWR